MIVGPIYSLFHLLLGILAGVLTYKKLRAADYSDGCFVWLVTFIGFWLSWITLLILAVLWAVDVFSEWLYGGID